MLYGFHSVQQHYDERGANTKIVIVRVPTAFVFSKISCQGTVLYVSLSICKATCTKRFYLWAAGSDCPLRTFGPLHTESFTATPKPSVALSAAQIQRPKACRILLQRQAAPGPSNITASDRPNAIRLQCQQQEPVAKLLLKNRSLSQQDIVRSFLLSNILHP